MIDRLDELESLCLYALDSYPGYDPGLKLSEVKAELRETFAELRSYREKSRKRKGRR